MSGQQNGINNGFNPMNDFVATQVDFAANNTLAAVAGLTSPILELGTYSFDAYILTAADATGGEQFAIGGTATGIASISYHIKTINNTTKAFAICSPQTTLGGAASQAGSTSSFTEIHGTFTCTSLTGFIGVQYAQSVASGTSSVLVKSRIMFNKLA